MPYLKEIEELFHAGNDHPSESFQRLLAWLNSVIQRRRMSKLCFMLFRWMLDESVNFVMQMMDTCLVFKSSVELYLLISQAAVDRILESEPKPTEPVRPQETVTCWRKVVWPYVACNCWSIMLRIATKFMQIHADSFSLPYLRQKLWHHAFQMCLGSSACCVPIKSYHDVSKCIKYFAAFRSLMKSLARLAAKAPPGFELDCLVSQTVAYWCSNDKNNSSW